MSNKAHIAIEYQGPVGNVSGFSLETDMDPEDASKVLLYAMQLIIHRNGVEQQKRAAEKDLTKKINDDPLDKSINSLKTAEGKKK